ncbi:amidohydrolase family protein [Desulfobaculum xiamenense]|nr:amidohydrolase family protein [Desulfobaculum xiamenense]
MFYDIHTHAFHPKIADKVLAQLEGHYGLPPVGTGVVSDLLTRIRRAGIDRAVVHTAATTPDQVIPANNWAIDLATRYEEIIAFGSVHPGFDRWEWALDQLEAAGIHGIKLHPDFQGYWLDDAAMKPIFEAMAGRFTVMIHVGDRQPPGRNPSDPYKVLNLHREFPKLDIIAAHMGGFMHWQWVLDGLAGSDVYIDTSSTLCLIDDATLHEIVRRHPRERILFGSDYPLFDPGDEMEHLKTRLSLTSGEMDELLTNAHALL